MRRLILIILIGLPIACVNNADPDPQVKTTDQIVVYNDTATGHTIHAHGKYSEGDGYSLIFASRSDSLLLADNYSFFVIAGGLRAPYVEAELKYNYKESAEIVVLPLSEKSFNWIAFSPTMSFRLGKFVLDFDYKKRRSLREIVFKAKNKESIYMNTSKKDTNSKSEQTDKKEPIPKCKTCAHWIMRNEGTESELPYCHELKYYIGGPDLNSPVHTPADFGCVLHSELTGKDSNIINNNIKNNR